MKVIHRKNSPERHHYLLDKRSFFELKPTLLYSGALEQKSGWSDEPHSHEFLEIIFVVEGEGALNMHGGIRHIEAGDIIIYNPGVTHAEQSSINSPLKVYFVAFDRVELSDLPKNHLLPAHYDCIYKTGDMYSDFKACFEMVIKETSNKQDYYVEISQFASRVLLMYLFRLLSKTQGTSELMKRSEVLDNILKYIDDNYLNNISLEDIAEHCHINKYYLSHLFAEYEGISVGRYINNKKIEQAKRLLRDTRLPVSKVAERSGFNDLNYFSRAFKKYVKLTPLQYRKSFKEQ